MNEQKEPFGYFRAEPFGWTDCAETDEGARPLYDQAAIDELTRQRDLLLEALDRIAWNRKPSEKPSKHVAAMEQIAINTIACVKGGAA